QPGTNWPNFRARSGEDTSPNNGPERRWRSEQQVEPDGLLLLLLEQLVDRAEHAGLLRAADLLADERGLEGRLGQGPAAARLDLVGALGGLGACVAGLLLAASKPDGPVFGAEVLEL